MSTADAGGRGAWWHIILIGLGLFVVGVLVFGLTGNLNLFPTVALLGNFLVPVAYVAFFYERRHLSQVTLVSIARAFFYGGVLGVFAAAVLEPVFIRQLTFGTAFEVGLIEEFAKILGVIVVARHHRHDSEIDGVILGGAAGMGFAALESSGYVFTAFVGSGGSLWDGLPPVVAAITGQGLDVFVAQGGIGLAGLVILWFRWREAVRRELGPGVA